MTEPDWRAINEQLAERYLAVERRAFEEAVLKLVTELPPIEEAGSFEITGRRENPIILGAELVGEYPDTVVQIRRYDAVRERESVSGYGAWTTLGEAATELTRDRWPSPRAVAGEMLMYARGG